MFYYIEDENKKIVFASENKEQLTNTLQFTQYKIEDIKSTKNKIVNFNGDYVFESDNKYFIKKKEEKIEELKEYNKESIYSKYSQSIQFDILAGIGDYGTIEEMKEYINSCLDKYNKVKEIIINIKDIEELNNLDIKKEYNEEEAEEEEVKEEEAEEEAEEEEAEEEVKENI